MGTPTSSLPVVDASVQEAITDEQARSFLEQGLLLIRNVISASELAELQRETRTLLDGATAGTGSDVVFGEPAATGERVPYRIEYVIDKSAACRALLGHPFILRSVEKLQGQSFIPTWDSMVFKLEGAGAAVSWHRDAGPEQLLDERPIFNVGFYLDPSDLTNCLWGLPGSHRWDEEEARTRLGELRRDGFGTEGATPLPMEAGDVILHNILVLHGSPPARSQLRRILYYEFRPIEVELALGPHTPEYAPLKQRILLAAMRHRTKAPYAAEELSFGYRPSGEFSPPSGEPDTYRVRHEEHWRAR